MYTVDVKIKGTAPLMQHRFPVPDLADMSKGGTKHTGSKDYTEEWRDYLYLDSEKNVVQPASHIEGALVKAAVNFKIQGKRGKTYKDLFRSAVFVSPDDIPHCVKEPEALDTDADKPLYLDVRPVVVQRARIVRIRPTFKSGWELEFEIEVIDDQVADSLLLDVLSFSGKTVGIGDFRPRFGRFDVVRFEVNE